jgi:hypothetical protein
LLLVLLLQLVLLLVSLLLRKDGLWLRRGVSFSPPRPPAYASAALASARWLGACCPAHAGAKKSKHWLPPRVSYQPGSRG